MRRRSTSAIALALPATATVLLLSGCVPLDALLPAPTPSVSMPAPTATAQAVTWEQCEDITIGAGDPTDNGTTFVAVRQERRSPGALETRDFIDEPFKASIEWEALGPSSPKVDDMIGEATGLRVSGSLGGFSKVTNALSANTANGTIVGFEAINHLTVPVTIACGKTLMAKGTLNTWGDHEIGILGCDLRRKPGELGRFAADAQKLYCDD